MPSFCFIFLPSSYTMHAPKQTTSLSSPHTDQSLAHGYVKPKLEFGFHLLMTSHKLTLNISSKPPPRNPPGKPGASEQSTNPSRAAGALLSEPYRKITARHPHKKRLRRCRPNLFAPQLRRKKKTFFSQPLPNPGAPATSTSPVKSPTEPSPTASGSSD